MALRIWLPLNGNLENKGVSDVTVTSGNVTIDNNGKIGQCYLINGTSSYIQCLFNSFNIFEAGWSFCFWIYPQDLSRWNCLLSFITANGQNYFYLNKDGTFSYSVYASSTPSYGNIELNKWQHITISFLKTGGFAVYKNGEFLGVSRPTTVWSNNLIGIKINSDDNSLFGNFKINDFRLYDHCLSAKEVKEISQGLILHYKLDGFSGGAGENLLKGNYHVSTIGSVNSSVGSLTLDTDLMPLSSLPGKTFTFTYDYSIEGSKLYNNTGDYTKDRYGIHLSYNYTNGSNTSTSYPGAGYLTISGTGRAVQTFTIPSGITVNSFSVGIQPYNKPADGNNNIWYLKNVKLEEGNIDTGWSLNHNDSGTILTKIVDSSGHGNDGVVINTILTERNSPRYQIATHIGSTSSKIKIDNLQTSGFGDSYTFAWWAKISSVNPMHWGFANGIRLNGMYTGRLWNTGDSSNNPLYNPGTTTQVTAPTVNIWHHWAMIGNGSKCLVYQDGQLWAEAKTYKAISGTTIYINGWDSSTSYCSDNLSISDFRIYATALSAEDILDLYHTPANIDNLGGIHGFEFVEKTPNLLNPDPREWTKESSVTCVWNEETGYFDVNTNRDTSVTSRWGVYTGVPIKPNTAYLFSAQVLDNKSYIGVAGGTSSRSLPSNIISWNGEKRYYYFFTTSSSHTHAWVYLCSKPSETTAGHFKNIYLGEVGEIASIKQNGIFENEDMVEYNENGRITKSGELAGSNFIEK